MTRALLLAALLAGCHKPGQPGHFSCWIGTLSGPVCEDYTTDLPAHEKACKAMGAEWEQHVCPDENLIGTCITDKQQPRKYYGGGQNAYTSDTASASCEDTLHGTWTSAQ